MKTFKRTLSCFLALLMIFGSFSVLSYAALDDGNENTFQVYTKFFVDGVETDTVEVGDTVKARAYLKNDYLMSTTCIMFVYPTAFMQFVDDALTLEVSTDTGDRYSLSGALNTNTASYAGSSNFGGYIQHQEGFVLDSMSPADNLVYDGFVTEDYWNDKGWVAITIDTGTPVKATAANDDDYLAEFTFTVKDTATADSYGYFKVVADSKLTPNNIYGFTCCERSQAGTMFNTLSSDLATTRNYNLDLSLDTNTIKLSTAPDTYAVNYAYAGDIPSGYTAPNSIQLVEGATIEEPEVTIPAGYELTWAMEGDVDGKMGTAAVTMTGTWSKIVYDVTYKYVDAPDGVTEPAADTTTVGEALALPTVTVPTGYTLTWAVTGATKNEHGVYIAGANDVEFVGTWAKSANEVTYTFTNAGPEGVDAPATGSTTVGATIPAPAVDVPAGWTLSWTAIGATKNDDGTYTAGNGAVAFVGTWAKVEYDVTYSFANEAPNSITAPAAGKTTVGATIAAPTTVAPAGYTLTWAVTGATKNEDGSYTAGANDVAFVGTWAKVEYAVTYSFANEAPNGITAPAADTTTVGATIAAPATVAPAGYTLTWAVTGATKNEDGSYTAGANDVAFVGTWAKVEYAVTYSFANEGPEGVDAPAADTTTVGATIAAPSTDAPEGWTLEWAVTGATQNDDGSYTAGANDVEFVGTWAKKSYTITYYLTEQDKADGKVYTTKTVEFDDVLPEVTPEVEGFTFNNWDYENEAGEIDDYATMPAYNLVAVASLTEIIYTVTFTNVWGDEIPVIKAYGEDLTEDDIPDLADGEDVNVTLTVDGEELVLPYTLTEDIIVDCAFTVDVVFYAEYDEENPDNNVVHKTYTFDYEYETTEDDFADLGAPVKTGYSLDADLPWTWEYVGTMLANAYFVANWVPNEYEAVFTAGDGAFAEGTVTTVKATYGAAIEFTAEPVLEGYSFKGWTDVEGGAALEELVMDAEGKTFYPVFVMNGSAKFVIELYLMNTEGKYEATPDKTIPEAGVVGVTVNIDHGGCQQYVDDWFSADTSAEAGNVYTGVIAEDGSTTLKLYYKRATVEITVNGEKDEYYVGEEIPTPVVDPEKIPDGYEQDGWVDENGDPVKVPYEVKEDGNPTEIKPNIVPKADTKYSVEIYLMDTEGNYGAASDVKEEAGTTDTLATAAHADYAQDAWFSADDAAANVYEANIDGDGNAVLKLYYKRATYKVSVDGAEATDVYHGATVTLPETSATTEAGYTLTGWTDGTNAYDKGATVTVTSALNITAVNTANTDTKYSVEIYLMDTEGNYGAASDVKEEAGTTDTTATAAHADYAQEAIFSADDAAANVLTGTIAGDGSLVLKLYYKRATVEITVNGEKDEYFVGEEIPTPTVDPDKIPDGYEQDGWVDENGDPVELPYKVKEDGNPTEIKPNIVPKADTKYSVEIYLMDAEGNYGTASDVKEEAGTTGTTATVAHADYAQEAIFSADDAAANVFTGTIAGDGSLVLKLYYKRATVEITVNGEKDEYFVGEEIPAPTVDPDKIPDGYEQDGWVDENGDPVELPYKVKEDGNPTEIKPNIVPKTGTEYTVEIYLMDTEGNYAETASKTEVETGKTGETVTIAHADYAQEAYFSADDAAANVLTGTVAGDGSLVLKLYYARATYDVVVDGNVVAEDVYHGTEVTLPDTSDNIDEGNELAGWTDGKNTYEPGETIVVEGNLDLTPVQKPSDATMYTISIYVMDVNGEYVGTSTAAYGTTGAVQTIVPDYSREGFTVDTEKSNLTDTITGDGLMVLSVYYARNLYTATFDGVEYQVYYGASLPEVEPAAQEGKEFASWTPEVPEAMPAEALEFTSTWTDIMYKLTYVINGTEEEYEYAYGATVTPIADPTVPGMTFIKWNKTIPTTMPAEDVIIVAEFEAAVFKVTFLDGDGKVFDEKAVQYGDTIVVPASNPAKEYHVFKGWLDVPATMPAANITIYPDFERVPVRLVGIEGSTTVIDRNEMVITGLEDVLNEKTIRDTYLTVEGDGYFTLTPAEGYTGYYGTGAKVEVYDNADTSAPIEVFYIVIYGDVNGDSAINSLDGSLVEDETMYVTSWSRGDSQNKLKMMAADLNKDGKIQANDADSIVTVALGITAIDQATGTVIR